MAEIQNNVRNDEHEYFLQERVQVAHWKVGTCIRLHLHYCWVLSQSLIITIIMLPNRWHHRTFHVIHCISLSIIFIFISLPLSFHSFKERGARNALDQLSAVSTNQRGRGVNLKSACSLSAILVAFERAIQMQRRIVISHPLGMLTGAHLAVPVKPDYAIFIPQPPSLSIAT